MLLAFSLFAFSINAAHSIIPVAGAVLLFPTGTAAATATAAAGTGAAVGSGYVAASVGAAITAGLVANQVLKGWGGKSQSGKDMWFPSGKNAPLPEDLPLLSTTSGVAGVNYTCVNFVFPPYEQGAINCAPTLEKLAAVINSAGLFPFYGKNEMKVEDGTLYDYSEAAGKYMMQNVYHGEGSAVSGSCGGFWVCNFAADALTMAYAAGAAISSPTVPQATPQGYNAATNTLYQATTSEGVQTTIYQNPDGGTTIVEATPNPGGGATAQAVQVSPQGLVTNIATQTYPTSTPAQATSTINGTLTGQSTNPSTNPSGNTSGNTATSLQIPTDYARQADMARAADGIASLNEKLSGTGTPTLPATPNFGSKIPTFLDPFVTGLNIPGGVCPAPQFSTFGKVFTFDSHCVLWQQNSQTLQLLLTVVWYCVALAIILSA